LSLPGKIASVAFLFVCLCSPAAAAERISLESVPLSGPGELVRLERLGFDVTEDVSPGAATVVAYSDAERALLAGSGFPPRTLVADLAAKSRRDRAAERRAVARPGRSDLPTGREDYREYVDYTDEMDDLVANNPGLVRPLVLGNSVDGVPIEGIEIAADVNRADDGRPVYLNMGLHHAREWPSGEFPMEFAHDLVQNQFDPRIASLLASVRTVIVPVVNPDGFVVSRGMGPGGDENRRKNCRPSNAAEALIPCEDRPSNSGVDLNRNYGAYWGGSGSSPVLIAENYRGPAPYSEPEAEAVHQFTAKLHPTVFITNHTFTDDGKWLRQPGFDDVIAVTPDEAAMKDLGDSMAAATGWTSELGYETLGDITGATEDWNYFAQGTYGYTPEARGNGFHDAYDDAVVEEYLGDAAHAGLGVREAFLLAGERTASTADHGVIVGSAPAGATLRLRKEFDTPTSQSGLVVHDVLDTALTVPGSGSYQWHVNPSSRPLVPGETWAMSCQSASGTGSTNVAIGRGQQVPVDWAANCQPVDRQSPNTKITKRPKNRSEDRTPKYKFKAPGETGATFECKLDRRKFKPCKSPKTYRRGLNPRKHRFRVRATDTAGNTDATPAKDRFRILP
jgi:hypothetical protein